MPTSRPYHLTWLCNKIIELQPKSILDIGVGFGSKGMLFREYTDVWSGNMFEHKARIDGVEIFDKYLGKLQKEIYDNIYVGNIVDIVDTLGEYDLIYMGDVLEHLERFAGEELINKLKKKTKHLIIVTPAKVSHQGDVYGNTNESHVSQWYPVDFPDFDVIEINNSMVLSYNKPEVYYCEGMKFYGERMMRVFGFNQYSNNPSATVLFMGLYFQQDYDIFNKHTGKKYVFWNGSDVLRLLDKPQWQEIVRNNCAAHICHNEQLRKELESVGIDALIEPIFFADMNDYQLSFKPKEQLEVYVNAHPGREDEYGVPQVIQAAKRLPDVKFFVYGISDKSTLSNVEYMGWLEEGEADNKMRGHHVCLRLNKHDGLSQLVIKAGLWGHYVITVQGVENTIKTEDVLDLVEKIRALKGTTEPCLELRSALFASNLNKFSWL